MFKTIALGFLAMAAVLGFAGISRGADDTSSLEGKDAPDFSLKALDDSTVKLSELKGKVVVVDFWATWCPPCRKSLPHLQKVHENKEWAGKGLKVYAVNAREAKEKAQKYLDDNKLSFAVPLDDKGETMGAYKVTGIPTTVIIGKDGKIAKVFIGFGGEESEKALDAAIEAALK